MLIGFGEIWKGDGSILVGVMNLSFFFPEKKSFSSSRLRKRM